MMRSAVLGVWLALAAGCGGRIEPQSDAAAGGDSATGGDARPVGDSVAPGDTLASGDSAADDAGESSVDASACTLANGALLCGGSCGNCPAGQCDYCSSAHDTREDLGVCALDQVSPTEPPNAAWCAICPAGYALCVNFGAAGVVPSCVLADLCAKAFELGMRDACTYQDHTLWSPSDQIPTGASCPIVGGSLCGGGCGDCAAGLQCVGRSPTHPCCAIPPRSAGQVKPASIGSSRRRMTSGERRSAASASPRASATR